MSSTQHSRPHDAWYPPRMARRRILGTLLLFAGVGIFGLTVRTIAWMAYGGARDFLQLGLLLLGVATALRGLWLLCTRPRALP